MIHNPKATRKHVQPITSLLVIVAAQLACADPSVATNCDVHAAAMVAEMKAAAATPMSDQEVSLVRETARKSCLAQYGGSAATVVAAQPAATPQINTAAAPAPRAKPDNSFFGTLGTIFSGPTERKPGNQRLLDRSQH